MREAALLRKLVQQEASAPWLPTNRYLQPWAQLQPEEREQPARMQKVACSPRLLRRTLLPPAQPLPMPPARAAVARLLRRRRRPLPRAPHWLALLLAASCSTTAAA